MKFINSTIDKIITRLGRANDSEITTAILAAFKLVFVPFATMNDKKSTKEEKAYAIKRDLTTESIALLGYLGITNVVKNNLTAPICAKYYKNIAKTLSEKNIINPKDDKFRQLTNIGQKALKKSVNDIISGNTSLTKEEKGSMDMLSYTIKSLNEKIPKNTIPNTKKIQMPNDIYLNTRKNLSHVCVLTLALSVIPFLTNKMMKIVNKKKEPQKPEVSSKTSLSYTTLKPINFNNYKDYTKSGAYNVLRY